MRRRAPAPPAIDEAELAKRRAFWAKCRERTVSGFSFFCESVLRIKAFTRLRGQTRKQWQWIPFVLNEAQHRTVEAIFAKLDRGESATVIVLKCRKLGISTVVQALGYWFGCIEAGWESQVVAHEAKATAKIAMIARGFAAHLPEFAKERLGADTLGAGLRWPNGSRLEVFTQKSDDGARGSSPALLHLSELAFWGKGRKNSSEEDALVSFLSALEEGADDDPDDDEAWLDGMEDEDDAAALESYLDEANKRAAKTTSGGTVTVIESTANGAQGAFYARWMAAQNPGSPWTPLFFAWQDAKKYQFPEADAFDRFTNEKVKVARMAGDEKLELSLFASLGFDELWCRRAVKYKYSVSQVRFALRVLAVKCNNVLAKFDQEFPSEASLAFAASGRRVWADDEVMRHAPLEPVFVSGPLGPLPIAGSMTQRARLEAAKTQGDCIKLWAWPRENWTDRYAMGSDVAAGIGGDYTTGVLIDRVEMMQVGELRSNTLSPDNAAVQLARLGECYGWANIAYEANNHGNVLGHNLVFDCNYPNLYRRATVVERDENSWIREFGYTTSERTRTLLAERLIVALRTGTVRVVSERVTAEMRTWVFDEGGRPDHTANSHDDLLIGTGLSLYAADQMREPEDNTPRQYNERRRREPEKARSSWA